jgi:hypothetical protein
MTQITNKLLKEAIADAEAVRETAIANAKLVLEESMGPQIKEMIRRRITAEASGEPLGGTEPEGDDEFPADSSDIGKKPNEEPSDDAFDSSEIGDNDEAPEDSEDDWYEDWDESDLQAIIKELEHDIAEMKGGDTDGEEDDSEEDMEDMEDSEEESEDEEELTEAKHDDDEDEEGDDEEIDLEEILRELDDEEHMDGEDEEEVEGEEEETLDELSPETLKSASQKRRDQAAQLDKHSSMADKVLNRGNAKVANKLHAKSYNLGVAADKATASKGLSPATQHAVGLKKEVARLRNELAQYQEALQVVRGRLLEVNLLNAKLLFTNKLFRKEGLNNDQKVRIVESFDRATTVREVKLVYTALMENISMAGKTSNGSRKKVVAEGLASKATRSTAPRSKDVIVENAVAKRLQELAGII